MRTLNDLSSGMPEHNLLVVTESVEHWGICPKAIDALVNVFLAIRERGISVGEVLLTWERYDLHHWSVDFEPHVDEEIVQLQLEMVYHDLRLPIPKHTPQV